MLSISARGLPVKHKLFSSAGCFNDIIARISLADNPGSRGPSGGSVRFASTKSGLVSRLWGQQSNDGTERTSRWSMLLPAVATHISLGAPYGWSAISATVAREHGFVTAAGADWSLDLVTYPMSIMLAVGGVSAALVGKWQLKVGVRAAMAAGAGCFGSGLALTAAGIASHSLPLVYTGNVLAGLGYGCAYTPPIQALINWFPDKKGLASGIVIGGFGSGALFFTPAINALSQKFSSLPTYLGQSAETVMESGRQYIRTAGGELQEVVYATASDLAKLPYPDLAEGWYLVGTGNTGVAAGLATMGAVYFTSIFLSSLMIKRPPPGYLPAGYTPPVVAAGAGNVPVDNLLKTPQFWLLWSTATLLATGGMGLMSVAKPMIQNVFTDTMPLLVTPAFASGYLMAMAAGNLGGRLGWAAVSDKIGRWNTFQTMTLLAIPLFAGIPPLITATISDPTGPLAPYYLAAFCGSTVAALTVMGGTFAVLPAYEADLYGSKYIGAIHGRFLTFAAAATVAGPMILLNLRKMAEVNAINELLTKVDPQLFLSKFGVAVSEAPSLMEAKTLTITKLMTIMPPGTVDPSPFLYNNTMYTMAGLVSLASALHFMVGPVDRKHFEKEESDKQ